MTESMFSLDPKAVGSPLRLSAHPHLHKIDLRAFDSNLYAFDVIFDVPCGRHLLDGSRHREMIASEREATAHGVHIAKLFKIDDLIRELAFTRGKESEDLMDCWAMNRKNLPIGRYTPEERAAMALSVNEDARREYSRLISEIRNLLESSENRERSLLVLWEKFTERE